MWVSGIDTATIFHRSESNWAFVGYTGQTSSIHIEDMRGPTSQLTGFKWTVANILVPDTTTHFQGSSGVKASGLCWKEKRDQHNTHNVINDKCILGWINFSLLPVIINKHPLLQEGLYDEYCTWKTCNNSTCLAVFDQWEEGCEQKALRNKLLTAKLRVSWSFISPWAIPPLK